MAKLKETLIESEQTIRKLLELKKPRSMWEGICGLEVNNIFTETPKQHQEKTSTSPAEVEKEKHKVTNPLDSNNNRPNLPGVLSSDRLSNSFNFRVKNRDRKMTKCEPNKSLEKACKQRLRRPEDEAKMEILIGGSNFDVCDGGRNSNLRTRVISYENFLETENCSGRQQELQSHSKHNFSRGDFNFSNCCNARNVQSPHSVDAQNKPRSFNRRHHNRHSTNTLSLDQPFEEPENLPKETIGNPNCENPWKNIEGQNNRGEVDYTSSDCSECFSSGGRTRKTKSRSRICEKHMKSVGTTMNTSVHEEPANQPPLKSFNIANGKSLPLGCCRNSFQLRPPCGVASDVTYDAGEGHYSNLNDERISNDSSGRLGKRNFSQNYEYCSLCEGQCRDSEFVAVVGKEDKVWLERGGLNKYWKEKAVQTDDVFQRNPKNYTLCDQNDLEEGRCDSRTSTTQAKNNNNNQKAICCPPRCQNHLSLENHPTKPSYSSASSMPAEDTKTFAGQTDIIDLIDEVTSEEVTKQARTQSTQNQSKHTTGQHSGLQESNRGFSNSVKNIGLRKQPSRHDEVFSSGQRIVRAIEDELQGIKPYVSKVNRAAVMRLANKEISKISDFLSTFSDNKCNNVWLSIADICSCWELMWIQQTLNESFILIYRN